ncbi:Uu.00g003000.m01.CDS01 [Anthostomella pinea]|uniref:Uu.00g003000.m01.CDS01 n=1 Tax=Anthostomella pinea TaxID=933095 RepID=A0AAI8VJN1_9PEZI|nr:Uu.00g003000.m01.CDS01 [Anthostomella pinea]
MDDSSDIMAHSSQTEPATSSPRSPQQEHQQQKPKRRKQRTWNDFELTTALALICKGEHKAPPSQYRKRRYTGHTNGDGSNDMIFSFATKLNEALNGAEPGNYDRDIPVRDVRELLGALGRHRKGAMSFLERQGTPMVLTRTKKRVFMRELGFDGSMEEWVVGQRREMVAKERETRRGRIEVGTARRDSDGRRVRFIRSARGGGDIERRGHRRSSSSSSSAEDGGIETTFKTAAGHEIERYKPAAEKPRDADRYVPADKEREKSSPSQQRRDNTSGREKSKSPDHKDGVAASSQSRGRDGDEGKGSKERDVSGSRAPPRAKDGDSPPHPSSKQGNQPPETPRMAEIQRIINSADRPRAKRPEHPNSAAPAPAHHLQPRHEFYQPPGVPDFSLRPQSIGMLGGYNVDHEVNMDMAPPPAPCGGGGNGGNSSYGDVFSPASPMFAGPHSIYGDLRQSIHPTGPMSPSMAASSPQHYGPHAHGHGHVHHHAQGQPHHAQGHHHHHNQHSHPDHQQRHRGSPQQLQYDDPVRYGDGRGISGFQPFQLHPRSAGGAPAWSPSRPTSPAEPTSTSPYHQYSPTSPAQATGPYHHQQEYQHQHRGWGAGPKHGGYGQTTDPGAAFGERRRMVDGGRH